MAIAPIIAILAAGQPEAAAAVQPAPAPQPASQTATQGVISYPAEFFAAAQPNTAMDMIDRLPGFSFNGGDSVRGFAGAAGNVLIDGQRPTAKNDSLGNILRRVPASQIERIDLIRGSAPGIDMQGQTVLANIVRKGGVQSTGVFAVAGNFIPDGREVYAMRIEGSRRNNGRLLEGGLFMGGFVDDGAGDGVITRRDAAGRIVSQAPINTEGDGQDTMLTGAYETPLAGGKFKINGQIHNQRFFYDESLPGIGGVQRDNQEFTRGELGLRYDRALSSTLSLESLLLQQLRDTTFSSLYKEPGSLTVYGNDRFNGESIGRAVVRWNKSSTLSLEVGVEGAYNWLDSETEYASNGTPVDLPAANVKVDEKRGEVFVNSTYKPWSTLTLESGLRMEASRLESSGDVDLQKTFNFLKPRAVATWSPNALNQLRVRVERQVGQLNFNDFTASSALSTGVISTGNPNLEPEHAWVFEAAYERRFWGNGAIVFTARHFEVTDAIDRAPIFTATSAFDSPANIGDGTKDELEARLTLPLQKLGVTGGLLKGKLTYRDSTVIDPTTGQERELSDYRPVEYEMNFTQDLAKYKLNWGVNVFSQWRETFYRFNQIQTYKLKTWVHPFLEYRPKPDLSIRFEMPNATARGFKQIRQVYAGPRNTSPLSFEEVRDLEFGRSFYVRLRKTWG
jgi:outer membrane receptor protein involved in Fe transport